LVIRWGYQNGKQRYRCKNCGQLFTWRNESKHYDQLFVWFSEWILGKQTIDQLSKRSGYSKSKLQRILKYYLDTPPVFTIPQKEKVHIILDGTYFSNDICLVVYRNSDIKCTQLYRLSDNERYEEIREDLLNLKVLNIQVESVTCDGHRAILKAIKSVFRGKVPVQRCLVHIQRMSRIWLTKEPKSIAGKQLLRITQQIHKIDSEYKRQEWLRSLYDWDKEHRDFINETSLNPLSGQIWYKHRMLRRVRRLLINAFPNMFHFLIDNNIPKTTNSLESFFGHLKDNLSIHRGLSMRNRKNFIRWYMYFRNKSS
jgi:hypothetical protein